MGEPSQITRRTMVGALAAAGAASVVRPAAGAANVLPWPPSVSRQWVGALSGTSAPLPSRHRFAAVGIEWQGPADARIELRTRAPNGHWSPWAVASSLGHDADGPTARSGGLFGEPIWTGTADQVQLRSDRRAHGLRLAFVSLPGAATVSAIAAAAALPPALPVLDAGPGQPAIIARQAWAHGHAKPRHRPEYGSVKLGFVHHTVSPNGYSAGQVPAMVLAIYAYHVHVRGWWDIGYNFVVDRFGRVWEARAGGIDMAVVGAQAGGYNAESTGVAVLGDFMNAVPSTAALGALKRLLAWKLSLHGVPTHGHVTVRVAPASAFYTPFRPGAHVRLPRVAGHRQGDSTDCPGNALFGKLPSIRPEITRLAGTPARITLHSPREVSTAGVPVAVSGQLATLAGAPLAGAPVELQELERGRARTVTLTTTDSQGGWSTAISLQRNAALRALHRPGPATLSDWQEIPVAPAITLELVSTSPLQVSGTISPATRRVTIDVYRAAARLGKPIAHTRLTVKTGSFSGKVPIDRTGSFLLVARSARDSRNAAGASAPLAVSLA